MEAEVASSAAAAEVAHLAAAVEVAVAPMVVVAVASNT